jgi:WD40 repeat protein
MSSELRKALELICKKANPPHSPFEERLIHFDDIGLNHLALDSGSYKQAYFRGLQLKEDLFNDRFDSHFLDTRGNKNFNSELIRGFGLQTKNLSASHAISELTNRAISTASLTNLPDSRWVSGSDDRSLKVWRELDGEWRCEATLEGHGRAVNTVLSLSDGRLVSGSDDDSLKVWREREGEWRCEATLEGHDRAVNAVLSLSDGRLVSGSDDRSLKVWRERDGEWRCEATLEGHYFALNTVLSLSDGRLVGHYSAVNAVLSLSDGRLVSASSDGSLKVWRERRGVFGVRWRCEATLEGHEGLILSILSLSDGRLVSGSDDCSLKVWREWEGEWRCVFSVNAGISEVYGIVLHGSSLVASGAYGFAEFRLNGDELIRVNRIIFDQDIYQQNHKNKYKMVTPFEKGRYWQTANINGKRLPADPDLHKYTYYRCENNAILPAYEFSHLIDWIYEDDDPNKPRTLIMYNPGHEPGAKASQENE